MKLLIKTIILLCFTLHISCKDSKTQTFQISSTDYLKLNVDQYPSINKESPLILLFHQAGFSRGEYLEIAPKLNDLGFACLAVDQRSGKEVNGIKNETYIQAKEKGLKTDYISAYPDLVATLKYTKKNHPNRKIIVWGSSYSASLVFILAAEYSNLIDGLVSFSPGEYFTFENKMVSSFCKDVKQPVFITSSKSEEKEWSSFKQNINNPNSVFYLPNQKGKHGSKALWKNNENHNEYWKAVEGFLNQFK